MKHLSQIMLSALLLSACANLGPDAPAGSTVTVNTSTPGLALVTFTSPTALPAAPTQTKWRP